ncbi:MAG: cell division protein ZapA [Alphaproteobacteria bacterium]|nr:cell division protein ZapA [Alphaproteobacteria bacterium]MBQ3593118.1 cell division protein ZapA [Clostridia bacterium]MBR6729840.1 cell division protein ZapA [Alphaproteobacteria bacterium]
MAVVSLKIGGRYYKFSCADGQESYMASLAENLDTRAEKLLKTIGFMQEGQLLAMLCLLLAEEKSQIEKNSQTATYLENQKQVVDLIQNLTMKINSLTESLSEEKIEEE